MKAAIARPPKPSPGRRFLGWLAGFEDGQILRAAFFGMLAATLAVLVIDYLDLDARDAALAAGSLANPVDPTAPIFEPAASPGGKPGPALTTDRRVLEQPLALSLVANGTLQLVGTIDKGAADRFAAEIAVRGEYVKSIALNSPGGSVEDALQMGRLIRAKSYATSVAAGALCASSCPLVFAGGKRREASAKAAIGVHQFYVSVSAKSRVAHTTLGSDRAVGLAMEQTQKTTAEITRYLVDMGVDPALWLHALDTPPDQIYYFSGEELANLKLVTNVNN